MTPRTPLVEKVLEFVQTLFREEVGPEFVYHSFQHTLETEQYCVEIAQAMQVPERDLELLRIAALCHDIGFADIDIGHEEAGGKRARAFLEAEGVSKENIQTIIGCIMATKVPQQPKGDLQTIICDADLYNVGLSTFVDRSNLLRKEWAAVRDSVVSDEEWYEGAIAFLSGHSFHTAFAQKHLIAGKEENIQRIHGLLANEKSHSMDKKSDEQDIVKMDKEMKDLEKEIKKKIKEKRPDRGVETMFRTTSRNHIQLSAIADNKANIMLSINAIIISIVVSSLVPKLEESPFLEMPSIVLLSVCIGSVIFATLSTIPKITAGVFSKEDIRNKTVNLLFFGNFHGMDLKDFLWGMDELMSDRDFLYGSLARDLYFLGKVLHKKYRFLRICYGIFMYGLILSVISFAFAYLTK